MKYSFSQSDVLMTDFHRKESHGRQAGLWHLLCWPGSWQRCCGFAPGATIQEATIQEWLPDVPPPSWWKHKLSGGLSSGIQFWESVLETQPSSIIFALSMVLGAIYSP
jgi:hypothetical protein